MFEHLYEHLFEQILREKRIAKMDEHMQNALRKPKGMGCNVKGSGLRPARPF